MVRVRKNLALAGNAEMTNSFSGPMQLDPPYGSPNSLSASLEISAGSSIPNRPIAMIFSATSCVMGSSPILQSQRHQGQFVSRHQTFDVLRLENSVLFISM